REETQPKASQYGPGETPVHPDPYADSLEDWDEGAFDPESFSGGDAYFEDQPETAVIALSQPEAARELERLWQWLRQGDLTGASRAGWAQELRSFQDLLKNATGQALGPELQDQLQGLLARAFGSGNANTAGAGA